MKMYIPLFIVIISNTCYHIFAKSAPKEIDTFASLFVTYLVAAVASLLLFFVTKRDGHLILEFKQVNASTILLGLAIIGLEAGFLLMYRYGWDISIGQLIASVGVAVVLIFVGSILYKEPITFKRVAGIVACLIGMYLIN